MINKALVDSGVFIAFQHPKDPNNEEARTIIKNFKEGEIKEIFINDFIILETINFLLRKESFERTKIFFDYFLNTDRINIIYCDTGILKRIKELFDRYKTLSITDCSLIALAEELKIKEIFSFDSGFDKVKGIKRLESLG